MELFHIATLCDAAYEPPQLEPWEDLETPLAYVRGRLEGMGLPLLHNISELGHWIASR